VGLAAALLLLGQVEFGGWLPAGYNNYPLGFLCLPFLLWAAFRFGPSEAAAALVFLSGMAVWGTLHGFGPFVGRSANESLLLLESFLAVTSVTTLGVAAVVLQQRQAEAEILELNRGLERRVQERTAELAQSNADLEAFTSSVSHDLRAPVRHIREFSRLVLDRQGFRNMDEVREAMEAIHGGALHMGQLIDDLLRLSRIGGSPLERVPVDMRALVDDAAREFRELPGRGIRWEIGAFGAWRCDPGLARVAFRNLVENAVKFTRPREQAVIRIGETRVDGRPVLFVSDNGVGFSMSQAPRLFRVFQRLHSDFEGTGVGLATVHAIVHKHGGRIWVQSAPDEGATFYFTFGPD
jgi:signal transduction histidine kinase